MLSYRYGALLGFVKFSCSFGQVLVAYILALITVDTERALFTNQSRTDLICLLSMMCPYEIHLCFHLNANGLIAQQAHGLPIMLSHRIESDLLYCRADLPLHYVNAFLNARCSAIHACCSIYGTIVRQRKCQHIRMIVRRCWNATMCLPESWICYLPTCFSCLAAYSLRFYIFYADFNPCLTTGCGIFDTSDTFYASFTYKPLRLSVGACLNYGTEVYLTGF